jgi:hypothetical protein
MAEVPTWEVDLYVEGPVTLRSSISTRPRKGFRAENPFYSDVEIMAIPSGLKATVTARAPVERLALEAAVFFFGRMLDVLAFTLDRPLYLSLTERGRTRERHVQQDVRRIIEPREVEDAFKEADLLATSRPSVQGGATTNPSFLRSLGWYRKGLYTDDPFDKFLAFWNAIEIVAARYYRHISSIDQERARKGCKNQIWECFQALWGPCEQWPTIPGYDRWIDESYDVRKDVAHGAGSVDVDKVASVASRLDVIREVAHRFLQDWRQEFLEVARRPPRARLPDSDCKGEETVTLTVLEGPHTGHRFPLNRTETLIGRQPDAAICLESPDVSRKHAAILWQAGAYYVEDVGSTNGTYVNGTRVTGRTPLTEYDTLQIGRYHFALRPESAERMAPKPTVPGEVNVPASNVTLLDKGHLMEAEKAPTKIVEPNQPL